MEGIAEGTAVQVEIINELNVFLGHAEILEHEFFLEGPSDIFALIENDIDFAHEGLVLIRNVHVVIAIVVMIVVGGSLSQETASGGRGRGNGGIASILGRIHAGWKNETGGFSQGRVADEGRLAVENTSGRLIRGTPVHTSGRSRMMGHHIGKGKGCAACRWWRVRMIAILSSGRSSR